jgi:hypothetical protein
VRLVDIENSLPNGFHDAFLESVDVDYMSKRALIKLRLCIGDPDASTEKEREAYRGANLELLDVVYLVIEGPDPRSKYAETKGLWIDGGEVKSDSAPAMPIPVEQLPSGAFAYWFFVRDWNSFIHVAARDAKLQWSSEGVSPSGSTVPTKQSAGW